MRLLLVVAMMASGCVHADRVALMASTAAITCDGMQTLRVSGAGWPGTTHERNPIMGSDPGPAAVSLYFLGAVVINAALWVTTPPKYRSIAPSAIAAFEIGTIVDNESRGATGVCGF